MIGAAWNGLRRFWAADHGLSVLLLLLLVRVFLLPVLAGLEIEGPLLKAAADVVLSLLLLAGASAVSRRPVARVVISVATVVALAGLWGNRLDPSLVRPGWQVVSFLTATVLLTVMVLAQVFSSGRVTLSRILGAVAAYLLLGLVWVGAYHLVELAQPAAFAGLAAGDPQHLIYFSFVTLTTTGYGDVTPLHPAARSLAMLEALVGQLYPAILIARLVSLEAQSRTGP